jgi:hypothetical protein
MMPDEREADVRRVEAWLWRCAAALLRALWPARRVAG